MHTLSYALYGYKYWSKICPPYLVVENMSHFKYWSKICLSKKRPLKICPSEKCPSKICPGAVCSIHLLDFCGPGG